MYTCLPLLRLSRRFPLTSCGKQDDSNKNRKSIENKHSTRQTRRIRVADTGHSGHAKQNRCRVRKTAVIAQVSNETGPTSKIWEAEKIFWQGNANPVLIHFLLQCACWWQSRTVTHIKIKYGPIFLVARLRTQGKSLLNSAHLKIQCKVQMPV